MKALNPQFQPLLDQGQALKEQLISDLNKDNKNSLKFELRAWFNSVTHYTQGSHGYGTERLGSLFEHADFYLETLTPAQAANQIDRAIEIVASIPPKERTVLPDVTASMELQKLMALARAAMHSPRKHWDHFLERLNELKRSHRLRSNTDEPIVVSELIDDLLRNIAADPNDTEREAQTISEEYERLKTAVEERIAWITRMISGIAYAIGSILLAIGAFEIIWEHPFKLGAINIILGVGLFVFLLMELLGVLHHLASLRARLESLIRPRLRRFFGTEAAPTASVLGLRGK